MKTISIEKFIGLQVQPNSFTVPPGALDRAENVVFSSDFIISKRRGWAYKHLFQDDINTLFEYRNQIFALASTYLARIDSTDYGQAQAFSGTSRVVVRKTSHNITNSDYISAFSSQDETFTSAFEGRYSAFCGLHQVQTVYTGATISGDGSRVLVVALNHGMNTGDSVSAASSTLSVSLGTKAISACGANAFAWLDSATGTGTVDFVTLDAYAFSAAESAGTSGVSAATGVSWEHYERLSGTAFTVTSVSRSLRSNNNLYWTTDNGLYCLESSAGSIREAGIPPGLDLDGYLSGNSGGCNANSQTAWRIVFGLKDSNDNLHLGAPSEPLLLTNAVTAVASGSIAFSSGTHVASATVSAHGLSTGDELFLYSVVLSGGDPVPDGSRLFCTSIDSNTFSIDLDDVGSAATGLSSFSYGTRKSAVLYSSIPSEILSTDYIYQVYRVQSDDQTVIPEPRYKIIDEKNITATDISRGFITYTDSLPEELAEGNAELYTNPTQEGEAQANARPPLSADLVLFKNYIFYANNTQYRQLELALIAPSNISNGDTVTIAGAIYKFYGNAANEYVGNALTTAPATTSSYVEVTWTNHGLAANDYVNVISSTGLTGLSLTEYQISAVPTPNTFRFATGITGSGTVTFEGLLSGSAYIVKRTIPTTTTTLAEAIDATARALIKAINRNTASTIYAQYASSLTDAPGNMLFTAKDLDLASFSVIASATLAGQAFSPVVPTTGTTVSDTQVVAANELLVSKYLEPEAVPLVNVFPVGSKEANILRIAALRDSLIILKEDGVFRLNGDSPSNYVVTQLDSTVILKATRSVAVLNNSVYALTNQGVVQISDTAVRIVSRNIETILTAVLGNSNLDTLTSAYAYESDRLYLLSTIDANTNPTSANVIYAYHYLTETWTTFKGSNVLFWEGRVSQSEDRSYLVTAGDRTIVTAERKDSTKIDFTGQDICVQVFVSQIATAAAVGSATGFVVTTTYAHGLKVGSVVTLSKASATLAAVYGFGTADIEGVRVVTAVTAKTFTVQSLNTSSAAAVGTIYWQKGISETAIGATTSSGVATVVFTTSQAHGFSTGDAITIDSIDSALAAGFSSTSALTGYRTVTRINATSFSVNASSVAIGTVAGDAHVSDRRRQRRILTLVNQTQPQVGDAVVTENRIYQIVAVYVVDSSTFLVTLNTDYKSLSTAEAHLHDAYKSVVRLSPITAGTGVLKFFMETQVWFRNSSSCSAATMLFSSDAHVATGKEAWRANVGSPPGEIIFGGWGENPWGQFPWGGGANVARDYRSGPAVILRMYVPRKTYMSTWLSPQIEHDVAGEPLEIQSISFLVENAGNKVGK